MVISGISGISCCQVHGVVKNMEILGENPVCDDARSMMR